VTETERERESETKSAEGISRQKLFSWGRFNKIGLVKKNKFTSDF
jgi:hypothetical protein